MEPACDEKQMNGIFGFAEESDVRLAHVNLMTVYKEPRLCFGGIKHSGAGLPEAGQAGIGFFRMKKLFMSAVNERR